MPKERNETLVEDLMSTRMITISQNHSVLDAAQEMTERNVSSLAITNNRDRISGVLTERDIVKAVTNGIPPPTTTVLELMTRPVISIHRDAGIEAAAKKMVANKIRHLIVVDSRGQGVGILTVTDLVRYLKGQVADEQVLDSEVWDLFF